MFKIIEIGNASESFSSITKPEHKEVRLERGGGGYELGLKYKNLNTFLILSYYLSALYKLIFIEMCTY